MPPDFLGIEQVTDEDDRAYRGSRFAEVEAAIFANPYQRVWGAAGEPPLPMHGVTLMNMLRGFVPFVHPSAFRRATERAVDSHADLRWARRKGLAACAQRGLPHRPLAHAPRTPAARILAQRQRGADRRALFDLLHRDAAQPRARALSSNKLIRTDPNHAEPAARHSHHARHRQRLVDYINDVGCSARPTRRAAHGPARSSRSPGSFSDRRPQAEIRRSTRSPA